tara:strand:- start:4076 stop:5167 length:1092 start_codon:yes stop_codon:yes gene_type:complete
MIIIKNLVNLIFLAIITTTLFEISPLRSKAELGSEVHSKNEKDIKFKQDKTYKSFYILGAGDSIYINFYGLTLFNKEYFIDRDGYIRGLPEIDEVYAEGLTLKELKKELITRFQEFIYEPEIDLLISTYRDINVYVLGEVSSPGLYNMTFKESTSSKNKIQRQMPTVFDAIKEAKGLTNNADISKISVMRDNSLSQGGGKIETEVNLLKMIEYGDMNTNITLHDKDRILIPKSKDIIIDQILTINRSNLNPDFITVFITGNVVRSGAIQLTKGSSLVQAIASTGGKKLLSGDVEFLRFKRNGQTVRKKFKYSSKATINTAKNPILMNGDVIHVKRTILGNTTAVLNEIKSPILSGYGLFKLFD